MKLKDKKTGEVVEVADNGFLANFDSLKELNEKYEDVPENVRAVSGLSDRITGITFGTSRFSV